MWLKLGLENLSHQRNGLADFFGDDGALVEELSQQSVYDLVQELVDLRHLQNRWTHKTRLNPYYILEPGVPGRLTISEYLIDGVQLLHELLEALEVGIWNELSQVNCFIFR